MIQKEVPVNNPGGRLRILPIKREAGISELPPVIRAEGKPGGDWGPGSRLSLSKDRTVEFIYLPRKQMKHSRKALVPTKYQISI